MSTQVLKRFISIKTKKQVTKVLSESFSTLVFLNESSQIIAKIILSDESDSILSIQFN